MAGLDDVECKRGIYKAKHRHLAVFLKAVAKLIYFSKSSQT